MKIPFNVPCSMGNEPELVRQAIENKHLSGNGPFTREVHRRFESEWGFPKVLLTHSCTGALEMAALLCDFAPGDEVILPTFTHVGTANAFLRAGAKIVFADSLPGHPNVDPEDVAARITERTRALVVVHYGGAACDMDAFLRLANAHGLILIEDAAHAIGARYKGRLLGGIGHIGAFSFHETKNITCGQGGLLILNDDRFRKRAGRIWENGTNRPEFFAGDVDFYTWVDIGSCFLPSDLNAAYLSAQLRQADAILARRRMLWQRYRESLAPLADSGLFELPALSGDADHNAHIFYLRCRDRTTRDTLLVHLNENGINVVFHYIPLHSSPYFNSRHHSPALPHADAHSKRILRLPLYHSLEPASIDMICGVIGDFVARAEVRIAAEES